MPDWIIYTIIGIVALIVLTLVVLLATGKIKLSELEFGLPGGIAKAKLTTKPNDSSAQEDAITAEGKSKVGNVNIEGAAPKFSATAKEASEIGDISIKRKL